MKKYLDIDNWSRKDHFHFFNQFDEPFWGVTIDVDCTQAYYQAKELDTSFFIYYLHKSIYAVNQIEEFKLRVEEENRVASYDSINASATINRPNGTFGFSYIRYHDNYALFEGNVKREIERVQSNNEVMPSTSSENVVHYSSLPWLKFTALSHARSFEHNDSVPKISFGKMVEEGGKQMMPVSIHVHHGLVDGIHVGQYCDLFQKLLNE